MQQYSPRSADPNNLTARRRGVAVLVALALVTSACRREVPSCCSEADSTASHTLPSESIWNLDSRWRDQRGEAMTLHDLAGTPTVIAMIFTHCSYACPRIVADLQAVAERVGPARKGVRFALFSMDPARDSPERLSEFAAERQLGPEFVLFTSDEPSVRSLAAALDLRYKRLANGDFAHSNGFVVVDGKGRVVSRVDQLGADSTPALLALNTALTHKD